MIILLIMKPKRSRAPPPPPPTDPIGNLGVARPEPEVAESGPNVVQPNAAVEGRDRDRGALFEVLPP